MILLWHDEKQAIALPCPMTVMESADFAWAWLKNQDYGKEPDHDGDNGKAFRVFVEGWGHVAEHHYAVVGIHPAWALYGK